MGTLSVLVPRPRCGEKAGRLGYRELSPHNVLVGGSAPSASVPAEAGWMVCERAAELCVSQGYGGRLPALPPTVLSTGQLAWNWIEKTDFLNK